MADDETVYSPATSQISLPSETGLDSPTDMVAASQIITRSTILEPGIYKMINLGSGTAADLHGGNNEAVIGTPNSIGPVYQTDHSPLNILGFGSHGGENQQVCDATRYNGNNHVLISWSSGNSSNQERAI
jgi:hypothetical protein